MGGCSSSSASSASPSVSHRSASINASDHRNHEEFESKLVAALRQRKARLDAEAQGAPFSFTKIILKFGTIHKVLRRIKSVFDSFDHDRDGTITRKGFVLAMDHLHVTFPANDIVQLFEVCDMTNSDTLKLREFYVMLAVARVLDAIPEICTPRASVVSLPSASADGNSSAMQLVGADSSAVAAAAEGAAELAENIAAEPAVAAGGGAGGGPVSGKALPSKLMPAISENEARMPSSAGPFQPTDMEGSGEEGEGAGKADAGGSFSKVKWSRIPSLQRLFTPEVVELASTHPEWTEEEKRMRQYGREVLYAMDLIIAAYFQFDPKAKGYIDRRDLIAMLSGSEGEGRAKEGGGSFADMAKWGQLAWDSEGRLSFEEFVYTFSHWLDIEEDEEDEMDMSRTIPGVYPSSMPNGPAAASALVAVPVVVTLATAAPTGNPAPGPE